MHVVRDDMWFCVDCMVLAVNGDGVDDAARHAACSRALESMGDVVPDFELDENAGYDAFSPHKCDCCGDRKSGERYRFAQLGL